MARSNPIPLFAGMTAIFAIFASLLLASDNLVVMSHEADLLHLLDILFRMDGGQTAHLDFATPIGSLAFEPIVWLMGPETGPGRAYLLANVLILGLFAPAAIWAAVSRLSLLQGLAFGLVFAALVTGMVHGTSGLQNAVSMHYNRWCWAVSFIAVVLAVLPSQRGYHPMAEGLFFGVAIVFLALIKATYAVAFAPPVVIALLVRRHWATLLWSSLFTVVLLGAYTWMQGFAYWRAYVDDMLFVVQSQERSFPSRPLETLLFGKEFIVLTFSLFASALILRQAEKKTEGLILLLLIPSFIYVSYQNFANDPQWGYLLPILLFAALPAKEARGVFDLRLRQASVTLALVIAALLAPSFMNVLASPIRQLSIHPASIGPLFEDETRHQDIMIIQRRIYQVRHVENLVTEGTDYSHYASYRGTTEPVTTFKGEDLSTCKIHSGLVGDIIEATRTLEEEGYAQERILFADRYPSAHALFGDFPAVIGASPWNYGAAQGLDNADYVLVPHCPINAQIRGAFLADLSDRPDISTQEVLRNQGFFLLRLTKS